MMPDESILHGIALTEPSDKSRNISHEQRVTAQCTDQGLQSDNRLRERICIAHRFCGKFRNPSRLAAAIIWPGFSRFDLRKARDHSIKTFPIGKELIVPQPRMPARRSRVGMPSRSEGLVQ